MPPLSHGQILAATLEGAWRAAVTPARVSAGELASVAPLLKGSGAAPLAWWKIRRTELAVTHAARELRQAYLYQTLRAALQEQEIETVFALLARAGVEALLLKGWSAARLYPEQGLRPFGDVDVCVRPAQVEEARRALAVPEAVRVHVDLHKDFDESDERSFDELYARGETLRLGEAQVRVLAAEDHLRLTCVHMLRHGAWRPLWLCDVAAALESRTKDFDWSRVLEGDRRRARWVACALGLARELLDARLKDTPVAPEALRLRATPLRASPRESGREKAGALSSFRNLGLINAGSESGRPTPPAG